MHKYSFSVSFLVDNDKLYTSTENGRINIYDISNLENPMLIYSENLGQEFEIKRISGHDIYATSGDYIYKFHNQSDENLKFNGLFEYEYYNPIVTDKFIYDCSMDDNLIQVCKNTAGTGIKFSKENGQRSFQLYQNYPNPFNNVTKINFDLIEDSWIKLFIYNINGQRVKVLYDGLKKAGRYQISWEGTDDLNQHVASGMYFYKLEFGKKSLTKKMIYLR